MGKENSAGNKVIKLMLLDTNIFVDFLRGYQPAVKFFEGLMGKDATLFSAITETELIAGKACSDPEKREKLLHFLYMFNKIEVTNPISVLAGDLTRKLDMEIPDAIIAATAIINRAELVTKNTKDFKKIERLQLREPY